MWTAPQFRQRGGGWDWMQMADMVIPGNIWDSRSDRFRPMGIAQGLTGMPVDTATQPYNRFGGDIGDAFRSGGNMLSSLRDRFRSGSNPNWSDPNAGRWGPQELRSREERLAERTRSLRDQMDAASSENTWTNPGARNTGVDRRRGQLGMGQLGSQSLANQMYYENAMRNRGGALMER